MWDQQLGQYSPTIQLGAQNLIIMWAAEGERRQESVSKIIDRYPDLGTVSL